jgi:hypothetical protein
MAYLVEYIFMYHRTDLNCGKLVCQVLEICGLYIFSSPAVDGNFHGANLDEFGHSAYGAIAVNSEIIFVEEESPFVQLVKAVFKP